MKITKLDALQKQVDNKLVKSKVIFNYLDLNNALFEISNNNKALSGKVSMADNKISFEDVISNYNRKYLGTIFDKALKNTGLTYQVALKTFSTGDIIYLDKNLTGQHHIQNFSYYGFNQTISCREMPCEQSLDVTYLGIENVLCRSENTRDLAKYKVN